MFLSNYILLFYRNNQGLRWCNLINKVDKELRYSDAMWIKIFDTYNIRVPYIFTNQLACFIFKRTYYHVIGAF